MLTTEGKTLSSYLKNWARHGLGLSYGDTSSDVDNEKVSLADFLKKHAKPCYLEIFPMTSPVPTKRPDETDDGYERRLVLWQADCDTRRAEARSDKRAVLHGAIACVLGAFTVAWVVGILAFLGYEHMGLLVPAIITDVVLLIGACLLFTKHDSMQVPS